MVNKKKLRAKKEGKDFFSHFPDRLPADGCYIFGPTRQLQPAGRFIQAKSGMLTTIDLKSSQNHLHFLQNHLKPIRWPRRAIEKNIS